MVPVVVLASQSGSVSNVEVKTIGEGLSKEASEALRMTQTTTRSHHWRNGTRSHHQQENFMKRLMARFASGVASAFKAKDCGPLEIVHTALLNTAQRRS